MSEAGSVFSEAELAFLHGQRLLGRVATVGADGTPHVAPVGWAHNAELDTIDVTGHGLEQTKKFRDAERTGRAAIVIDDLASVSPWRPGRRGSRPSRGTPYSGGPDPHPPRADHLLGAWARAKRTDGHTTGYPVAHRADPRLVAVLLIRAGAACRW
jgi:PPOX class F420-dependent enzyme/OxyR family protein